MAALPQSGEQSLAIACHCFCISAKIGISRQGSEEANTADSLNAVHQRHVDVKQGRSKADSRTTWQLKEEIVDRDRADDDCLMICLRRIALPPLSIRGDMNR